MAGERAMVGGIHKIKQRASMLGLAIAAGLVGTHVARADTLGNNGGLDLSLAGSWFDETLSAPAAAPPGATDIAKWDNLSAGGTFNLTVPATSWQGIVLTNPAAPVILGGATDTANALTLGASGIDMSAATTTLRINNPITIGATQIWNVVTGQSLTAAGTVNVNALGLTVQGAGNTTISGVVSGAAASAITMNGTGTLTLSGANSSYAGTVTLNSGVVAASTASSMGSGNATVIFGGGTLSLTGPTNTLYRNKFNVPTGASGTITLTANQQFGPNTGNVTGGGTLNFAVPAGVIVSNPGRLDYNAFTGTVALGTSAGDFRLVASSATLFDMSKMNLDLGSSTGRLTQSRGGVVTIGSLAGGPSTQFLGPDSTNTATPITIGGGTLTSTTFAGVMKDGTAGAASVVSLTLLGGNTLTLAGNNTYTGTTTISSGATINVGNGGTTGRLGTGAVTNNGALAYNPGSGGSLTATSAISGSGTLAHSGVGTTTFSGNNSFSGGTTINAGLIQADNATSALGTGAVTLNSTGGLGGRGNVTAAVTANTGSFLSPGDAGIDNGSGFSVGTLSMSSLSLATGTTLNYDFSSGANDMLNIAGAFTQAGSEGINLYQNNTLSAFNTNGTYNMFQLASPYSDSLSLLPSILNPVGTTTYTWGTSGNFVTLAITGGAVSTAWNLVGGGSWTSPASWTSGVPNGASVTATLGPTLTAPGTVNLDGAETVGQLVFNNATGGVNPSYTIAAGAGGSLTIDNGASLATITVSNGSQAISAPLNIVSNTAIGVTNAADTLTISGPLGGAGNLSVTGAGKVVLSGANTYTGTTTVTAATLQVGSGGTSGNLSAANVIDNGTLAFNRSDNIVVSNVISGTGTLVKNGAGMMTLGAANTYTGNTTINTGILQMSTGATMGTGPVTIAGGAKLDLNAVNTSITALAGAGTIDNITAGGTALLTVGNATSTQFDGSIANTTGTVGVTKVGAGRLTLTAPQSYSGNTTISAGSIRLNSGATLNPAGTIFINANKGLVLGNGATISNPITASPGNLEFMDIVDANASVTVASNITLSATPNASQIRYGFSGLSAKATFTGATNGLGQVVVFNLADVTFAGTGSLTTTGQILLNRGGSTTLTLMNSAHLSGGTADAGNNVATAGALSITIQDTASFSITGAFELENGQAAATNTSTDIFVNGGTLAAGVFTKARADLAHPANINLNGGTLAANADSTNWLPAVDGLAVNVNAPSTINDNGHAITIAASMSGGGDLTKIGSGVTTLSGSNGLSGKMVAAAGVLEFTTSSAYNSISSLTANSGAAVGIDTGSTDPGFLALLTASPTPSTGALALAAPDAAVNIDFTTAPFSGPNLVGMSIGALPAGVTYTGTITPASSTYRLGGGGGILTLPNTNALTGSNAVVVGNNGKVVLSGANNYTGTTNVNSGSLTIAAGGSITSGTITVAPGAALTVNGTLSPTATVNANGVTTFGGTTGIVASTQQLSALNIGTGVTVSLGHSAFPFTPLTLKPTNTTFADATAKLDITNNAFATTGTAAGALTKIQSGQILSSEPADPNKAIGYINLTASDAGKYEVRLTLKGDANLDGKVDVGDLGALATSYGVTGGQSWGNGDSNQDGNVDVGDLGALATNYGTQLAAGPSFDGGASLVSPLAIVATGSAVPEPASLGLLGLCAFGLIAPRGRRRRVAIK